MRALSSMLCTLDLESSVARDVMFEHTAQRPKASQLDMYTIKSFAYQQQFNVTVCSSPRPIFMHMSGLGAQQSLVQATSL